MSEERPAIGFSDIVESSRALFLVGLAAIPIGILTGVCTGIWFFAVGGAYGAIAGIPAGFVAALFGAASGRRGGWVLSGSLAGAISGYAIIRSMHIDPEIADLVAQMLPFAMLASAIGGGLAGWIVAKQLDKSHAPPRFLIGLIDRAVRGSPLYRLPAAARLCIAAIEALPVVVIIAFLRQQPW